MDSRLAIKADLNTCIKELRTKYLAAKEKIERSPSLEKLELIRFLELIHEHFQPNVHDYSDSEEDGFLNLMDEADNICKAAWIFCLEFIISTEGWPQYYGSQLKILLLEGLKISHPQEICRQHKIDYLSQLFHFLYPDSSDVEKISLRAVDLAIKEKLISMMQNLVFSEKVKTEKIMNSLPVETEIDRKMQMMVVEYRKRASGINKEREVLAKLSVALSKLNPPVNDPCSLFLKLGMLIYNIQSVSDESKVFNPGSELYKINHEILNGCFSHLNDVTKHQCLIELRNYLNDNENKTKLQNLINQCFPEMTTFYLNIPIYKMLKNIDQIIDKANSISKSVWTAAALGAFIAGLPAYGIGYEFGKAFGMMDTFHQYKNMLHGPTQIVLKILVGEKGHYLGYFASDAVVNATLQRLFAKTLEAISASLGALGLGGIVLTIKNFNRTTLTDLCHLYLHLQQKILLPTLRPEDEEYIQMLLKLPEEVFSKQDQEKLRTVTGVAAKLTLGFIEDHSNMFSDDQAEELHHLRFCK